MLVEVAAEVTGEEEVAEVIGVEVAEEDVEHHAVVVVPEVVLRSSL